MNQTDYQLNSLSNAVVCFIADVQKREVLLVQCIPTAKDNHLQSMETVSEIHLAAVVITGTEEADDSFPNLDTACSTVLTNSLFHCSEV